MTFVHLEVHSHFTLLGGAASVTGLAGRAAADRMSHLALTDTNALYGAVAFDRACRAAGVQPIIGMTVTTALPAIPHSKRTDALLPPAPSPPGVEAGEEVAGRVVLLAAGPAGYRSLCRLSSLIQSHADREMRASRGLSWDDLHAHREGLICLSGGRRGWIERCLRAGDLALAQVCAGRLAGIFDENAYLALEIHSPDDQSIAAEVSALGRRLGLPAVAVQPIYCLTPEDAPRLRLLAAIRENRPLEPEEKAAADLHWLAPAEVADRFAAFPAAFAAASEIAHRCSEALPDGSPVWPAVKLPPGETPDRALASLARAGLRERFGPNPPADVRARLDRELAAIASHGYAPIFLVVADAVRFARERDIPVSTRGSVANSLVAYCAGITTVDPIAHNLLFERFLNPARTSPPDIDLDLCSVRRDEVLDYMRETYGADRTALVSTISTLQPSAAVREVGKAYGLTEAEIKRIKPLLPRGWHPDPRRRDQRTVEDVLAQITDPALHNVVRLAYDLVGQPDHLSVHPGGVIVTPGPLTDFVPVQWAPKGFLITQFEHGDVEAIGLPKMDMLGIRALTVLADTAALVRARNDPGFRLDAIPLDNPATADLLARGETIGVFQCESEGAQRTLRKLRAHTVADLAIANAFFKPGPAMGGMADAFVRRYRGQERVTFLHPALEPILAATKGVLIFQEQILRIAREIAGLSWAQADQIRRGMSHFGADQMAAVREQFVQGCQRPRPEGPGFTPAQASALWEQIMPFAGYGFNQGHATAYADVSYRSAYLKAHYPAEFLCARLADWGGFHHPVIYAAEAVRLGIAVRPPHVNFSGEAFTLHTPRFTPPAPHSSPHATLWMGLGQVRDLRRSSIEAILAQRAEGPFESLRDLLARVALQPKEAVHLIQCGALDGLGPSRAALLAEAEEIRQSGVPQQMAFTFAAVEVSADTAAQRLAWEEAVLGWPVSVHPLALVQSPGLALVQSPGLALAANGLPERAPLRRLSELSGRTVTTAGVRLPGWTGGPGFFLGDGDAFVIVKSRTAQKPPPAWRPLIVRGRWVSDSFGSSWLQADEIAQADALPT
jgi:DNA-directed DNA polymerase III PolC